MGLNGSGIDEKIVLSLGAGLIDGLMIYPYHFIHDLLSVPFSPIPFCPLPCCPVTVKMGVV